MICSCPKIPKAPLLVGLFQYLLKFGEICSMHNVARLKFPLFGSNSPFPPGTLTIEMILVESVEFRWEKAREKRAKNRPYYIPCYRLTEYTAILSDPTSAMRGAFAELGTDALMVQRLTDTEQTCAYLIISGHFDQSNGDMQSGSDAYLYREIRSNRDF